MVSFTFGQSHMVQRDQAVKDNVDVTVRFLSDIVSRDHFVKD